MNIRFVVSIALPLTLLLLLPVRLEAKGKGKPNLPSAQPSTASPQTTKPSPARKTPTNKPTEDPVFEDNTPDSSDSQVEPSTKNAVPSVDAQQAATKLVKEVYGDEYENAKTPGQKKALARTLLQKAIETEKDLPGQYVLLRLSRDIATQSADGTTAFRAIAEMAKTFKIDDQDMKLAVLKKLSSVVHAAKQHEAVAKKAMELADKAISKENFPLAKQLNELAVQEVRNAKVPQLIALATEQTSNVEKIVVSFDAAQAAEKVLENKPDDPEANLAVGKYKCFVKGDWERGIPMLALGGDPGLRVLAAKDLAGAESKEAQIAMGDAWWDLAEKEDASLNEKLQGRAAYWYSKALPNLSGLTKDKVAKRLTEIGPRPINPLPDNSGGWLVIFRSKDPSIWNTNVNKGRDQFGMSLAQVPGDVHYLRMSIDSRRYVIIEIAKDSLQAKQDNNRYGWNGTNEYGFKAHHLGIYKTEGGSNKPGMICITLSGKVANHGWGFGRRGHMDDKQGYSWAGEAIDPVAFEIAVKSGPLNQAEKSSLLNDKKDGTLSLDEHKAGNPDPPVVHAKRAKKI